MRAVSPAVLAVALALASLAPTNQAAACSCLPPTVQASWNNADEVFAGRIQAERIVGAYRVYDVRISQDGTDCRAPGTRVQVVTPRSSSNCGTTFPIGEHWLFFANHVSLAGARRLLTNACAGNMPVRNLTRADGDWLRTRYVSCSNSCVDPTVPVLQCLVDPCTQVPACAGATCVPNYCGGCTAEFYDAGGYQVCTP
jgi:hypothetical protein